MSGSEALWAIVGIGESEEDDVSERDEEILASEMVDNTMQYQSDSPQEKMSGYEFLLSIAGQGHSSQHDISAHDEGILESEVDSRRGWMIAMIILIEASSLCALCDVDNICYFELMP